jgi:Rhs element Vgr protein
MSNFIRVEIEGLNIQPEIISLTGNEGISDDHSFFLVVQIPIDTPIDAISCLNQTLKIVYETPNKNHTQVGTITSFQRDFTSNPHHLQFTLECHSSLQSLKSVVRSNVFIDYSPLDIITEILNEYVQIDFHISCLDSLPNKAFIHQYKESDYQFINRLCEHWGIYYYFDSEQSNKLIFADDEHYPSSNNTFNFLENPNPKQRHDSITSLTMQENSIVEHIIIEGRNPKQDSQIISAEFGEPSLTTPPLKLNGIGIDNEEEAVLIAQRRLEQQQSQRKIYTGSSTAQGIKPGFIITIQLPGHQETIKLLVLTVNYQAHNLNSVGAEGRDKFTVNFSAIPADIIFRPQQSTLIPTAISSTARVYSQYDDPSIADRDELGRYRVIFDYMQTKNMSHWIRKNQTAAKDNHFDAPLLPDTEVQLAYLGGNPDLPYISCALENSQSNQPPSSNIHASATSLNADGMLKIKAAGSFSSEFIAPMNKQQKNNANLTKNKKNTPVIVASDYVELDNHGGKLIPEKKLSSINKSYNISVTTGQTYKIQDTTNYYLGDYPSFYFGQQYKEVHMKDPNQKSVNVDHKFSFKESHILTNDATEIKAQDENDKNNGKTKNTLDIDRRVGMVRKLFGNRYNYHDGNIVSVRKGDNGEPHKSFNYGPRYVEHIINSKDCSTNSITDGFPPHLQPEKTDYIIRNHHKQFKINLNDTVTIQKGNSYSERDGNTERIQKSGSRKATFEGTTLDNNINISGDINKSINAANINSVINVDTLDQTLTGDKRSITMKSESSIVVGAKTSLVTGRSTSMVVGQGSSLLFGFSSKLIAGVKDETIIGSKFEQIYGPVIKTATHPEIKLGTGNMSKEELSLEKTKTKIQKMKICIADAGITIIG